MTKVTKKALMIHKVNNGFIVGVAKEEMKSIFSKDTTITEIYVCKDNQDVGEIVQKILPQLSIMDDFSIENDDD